MKRCSVGHIIAILALICALSSAAPRVHAQASATFQLQVAAIRKDRESRTPAQKKIHSQLIYAARQAAGVPVMPGAPRFHSSLQPQADGRYRVKITAVPTPDLLATIRSIGGTVTGVFPGYRAIYALVPPAKFEVLAARADVTFISIPPKAIRSPAIPPLGTPSGLTHSVQPSPGQSQQEIDTNVNDPEGDATHGAASARSQYGLSGSGVAVGVISDSDDDQYGSYASALEAGYISPVNVPQGQSGSTDQSGEGLAMLEIVHRIAPGASLYFATSGDTEEQMAINIQALQQDGCQIIVDDLTFEDEDPFQDSSIAKAVNNATAGGVLYFSAAGNFGNLDSTTSSCWEGNFQSTNNDGYLDFNSIVLNSSTVSEANVVNSQEPYVDVVLFWAEPLGGATSQYNLYEVDGSGYVYQEADDEVGFTREPMQILGGVTPGHSVKVQLAYGTAEFLHLAIFGEDSSFGGASTNGRVGGHNACDAVNSFCIAATPAAAAFGPGNPSGPYPNLFSSASVIEPYSDDGPRRMFFNSNGTAITPGDFSATGGRVFNKPDFTAADGVTTSVPAVGGNDQPFYGTSCAAPHAAALAALAWSYDLNQSPSEVAAALRAGTIQVNSPGANNQDAGAGILMAGNILAAEQPTLIPAQPSGWSAPVVVSTTAGATTDSPTLTSTDTLFVSWAARNVGTLATTGTFYTEILLDGTLAQAWPVPPPLAASGTTSVIGFSLGSLPVGQHHLRLIVDYTNLVDIPGLPIESFTKNITVISGSTGYLTVNLAPDSAVNAGASWNMDGGAWQASGNTITGYAGSHTVNFSSIAGYYSPASQNVLINPSQTTTVSGTYVQIVEPAITSGSTASGIGGQPFSYQIVATNSPTSYGATGLPSGLTVSNSGLISGTPTATGTFDAVISAGNGGGTQTANLVLNIAVPTGSLTVTLYPIAAGPAGSTWNIDGGAAETTGTTVNGIPAGQHTISFVGATGYRPPASRLVNILYNQTVAVTGTFTTVPAIGLQQPAGKILTSGSSTVNFGTVSSGSSAHLTFTIVNNGASNLLDLTTIISGTGASQFQAGAPVNGGVAPGGSTTFVVTCSGTNGPTGAATLSVASNDPATPLFSVSLEATGAPASIDLAAAAGTFVGLIGTATDPGPPYSGYASLTLSKTGHVTGKLIYNGQSLPVTGTVAGSGDFTGKPGTLALIVNSGSGGVINPIGYSMAGAINGGTAPVLFTAYHAIYASKQAVPEAGKYTLVLAGTDTSASIPQGSGYASINVAKTGGEVTLSGKLADGTSFTASGPLVGGAAADQLLLFDSNLYKNKGLLAGPILFESLSTSDCDGAMQWLRPAGPGALYPSGFDADLNATGSHFTPLASSTYSQYLDGTLIFSGANLSGSLALTLSAFPSGKLEVSGSNSIALKVATSRTTGAITGSFKDPMTSRSVPFSALLFEKAADPQGAGFFISPSTGGTPLSGNVLLVP